MCGLIRPGRGGKDQKVETPVSFNKSVAMDLKTREEGGLPHKSSSPVDLVWSRLKSRGHKIEGK